jgi:hypothetical protein
MLLVSFDATPFLFRLNELDRNPGIKRKQNLVVIPILGERVNIPSLLY